MYFTNMTIHRKQIATVVYRTTMVVVFQRNDYAPFRGVNYRPQSRDDYKVFCM